MVCSKRRACTACAHVLDYTVPFLRKRKPSTETYVSGLATPFYPGQAVDVCSAWRRVFRR